jgi:hypothetical protein
LENFVSHPTPAGILFFFYTSRLKLGSLIYMVFILDAKSKGPCNKHT